MFSFPVPAGDNSRLEQPANNSPPCPFASPLLPPPHLRRSPAVAAPSPAPFAANVPQQVLQPLFFAAFARNLASMSPQQQQQQSGPSSSSASPLANAAFPFIPPPFGVSPQPKRSSPPLEQQMAHWLSTLFAQQPAKARRYLETDVEGNALCPACKECIGKGPTEWEKHLQEERERLREEIQSLKSVALKLANGREHQRGSPGAGEQRQMELLERIRQSQRRRILAKAGGHFYDGSAALSALLSHEDGKKVPQWGAANGDRSQNEAAEGVLENGHLEQRQRRCADCKHPSELIVLNQTSGAVTCVDCFQKTRNDKPEVATHNGHSLKRRSPPPFSLPLVSANCNFSSALELASGGVKEDQLNNGLGGEKRRRLELPDSEQ